jgi:hypothetical protein
MTSERPNPLSTRLPHYSFNGFPTKVCLNYGDDDDDDDDDYFRPVGPPEGYKDVLS